MDKRTRFNQRAVIYIKDIRTITGKKPGAARKLYHKMMRSLKKNPGQFLTYFEFCALTGIKEEVVLSYLAH